MSTRGAALRSRIASVTSAEKIVSALRLVAASRIRASSHAALRARPFAEHLQKTLSQLSRHIQRREIDIRAIAQAVPPFSMAEMHGPFLADPVVQKALMDNLYLTVLAPPDGRMPASHKGLLTILTVITADRKFCGGYNKGVIARAVIRLRQLQRLGFSIELVLVGVIAYRFFSRNFPNLVIGLHVAMTDAPGLEHVATAVSHAI